MSGPRRLLLVHPPSFPGENHGLFALHVASMRTLLDGHRGWEVVDLDPVHPAFPEAAMAADVVVLLMLAQPEIEALLRLRRARGRPTVFEVSDNFLALGDWLPERTFLRSPLVRQNLLMHAWMADALQVYAPGLEDLFHAVNPHIVRFDPYVPIIEAMPRREGALVVGWGGTTTHEDDLARVAPAIVETCRAHPSVVFAYIGSRAMFDRHFSEVPPEQVRVRPFGPYDAYLDFVRTWHIGLAPLSGRGFNAGRTDSKFSTYAACGVAPVLEDVPIFRPHADRALLFRTPEDLAALLAALASDRSRVQNVAARAWAWAREHRGPDRLRTQRDGFNRSLLADEAEARAQPVVGAAPPSWTRLAAASARLQPEEALAAADAGLRDDGRYAYAQWLLVASLEALGRFTEALQYLEQTTWPALYEGLAADARARVTRRLYPRDPSVSCPPASPVARLRAEPRGTSIDIAMYRELLRYRPYDFFALSAVIHDLARRSPDSAELSELYERMCLLEPERVPAAHRPARLVPFLPA